MASAPVSPHKPGTSGDSKKQQQKKQPSAFKRKGVGPKFYLSKEQRTDLKEAFDLFDKEGTGKINVKELKVAIRALGFEPKKDEMRKMINEVDKDGTGKLSFDDFVFLMSWKMSEKDSREDIVKAFRLIDEEETGKINLQQLQRVATMIGDDISLEELQEMIDAADIDFNDEVTQGEFIKIIRKTVLML